MWLKLAIISAYFLFILVIFRTWDWYFYGPFGALSVLRPVALSAKKLRAVLEHRGLLATGILEKKELAGLIENSGAITGQDVENAEAELNSSNKTERNNRATNQNQQIFTSSAHFLEQVEDCRDSAWLIQVLAIPSARAVVNEFLWKRLLDKLQPFGIRFGVFDCKMAPRMCQNRGWNTSRLLLALPNRKEIKGAVRLLVYKDRFRYTPILQWVYMEVSRNVERLESRREMSRWLGSDCLADVCLLLVSTLTLPPFFFSALTLKFAGRVQFATTTPGSAEDALPEIGLDPEEARASLNPRRTQGQYWVIAPQGRIRYGDYGSSSANERLTFASLQSHLSWLVPDLNDLFILSMALVNLCAVVSIFDLKGSPIQALVHFSWTLVKYNCLLLVGWIFLLSLANRQLFSALGRLGLSWMRHVTMTSLCRTLIGDIQWLANHRSVLVSTFFTFNSVIYYFRRRFWPQTLEEPEPWSEWFRIQRPMVVLNPGRPAFFRSRSPELEPRLRALVDQLNLPEYSVNPSLNFDFLFNLAIWSYGAQNWNNQGPAVHMLQQSFCFRCRCVQLFKMKQLALKLARRPCSRCGFNGGWQKGEGQACPICLDLYQLGDLICGLPCGHSYHKKCVFSWLLTDPLQTCPCCRWPAFLGRNKLP